MGENDRNTDFLLGRLDAMTQTNQRYHEESLSTLKEIRDSFTDHVSDDADRFLEIQTVIADAKGRVRGGVWVMSIVMTLVSLFIGFFGSVVAKAMGW